MRPMQRPAPHLSLSAVSALKQLARDSKLALLKSNGGECGVSSTHSISALERVSRVWVLSWSRIVQRELGMR